MTSRAAMRRLNRILSDEEYGPKLARLKGEQERRILTLIDENRGKEARAAILEADEERRTRNRNSRSNRVVNREAKEDAAVTNILRRYGRRAKPDSVRRNVGYMTDKELDFAKDATETELTGKARKPALRKDARGKDVNPFWYH